MTESGRSWICPNCRRDVLTHTEACPCGFKQTAESTLPSFGNPPGDNRRKPEKRYPADADKGRNVLEGYRALDDRSGGRYGEFLRQAARCTRCASDIEIPPWKQPIPLMCGTAGLDGANAGAFERGHDALAAYRREDGSLRFEPGDDGKARLTAFLDKQELKGLAMGHCGWGDLTARIRGSHLRDGVDLMILGADWYPLTQCSNFLFDRYTEWDHTVKGFMTRLGVKREGIADFFTRHRVYLGNALLCYRTGWDKTGDKNLSPRSFDHCRDEHLRRHIEAVAPRILVTFGANACRSVAAILAGKADDDEALRKLSRMEPRLKEVMRVFYENRPRRGIAAHLGDLAITFVPLCHPAWGHVNRYEGDYEALRELLNPSESGGIAREPRP